MGSEWFAIQRLREGIYLIAEPMHVNSYLIVGSRRAVLFDTGLGIQSIRRCAEAITDRPILAVNSHHHFDHVGGNHEFNELAFHADGLEDHRAGPPPSWLPSYAESAAAMYCHYEKFRAMDETWFQVLGPEMQMRPFPVGFDSNKWNIKPALPSQLLADGDEIDLGDKVLRVVHTPGHTPDSICLLDERERILFSGDTIDTGPMYAHLPGADIARYATTAQYLVDHVEPRVDDILSAHGARYRSYPNLLRRVAEAFQELQQGRHAFHPTVDCFMDDAIEARFNDFSLVVPSTYKCCPTVIPDNPKTAVLRSSFQP